VPPPPRFGDLDELGREDVTEFRRLLRAVIRFGFVRHLDSLSEMWGLVRVPQTRRPAKPL
jgi:hypothetical protein